MSETPRLCGFIYDDGVLAQALMLRIVEDMRAQGRAIAGAVQYDRMKPGRKHCDMFLENLATRDLVRISEDRGEGAFGCHLDRDAFAAIETELLASLDAKPDLLIVNKYGKTEVEGGGLRRVIAAAIERDIPVMIGVPRRNLDSWNGFVGGYALAAQSESQVMNWLSLSLP